MAAVSSSISSAGSGSFSSSSAGGAARQSHAQWHNITYLRARSSFHPRCRRHHALAPPHAFFVPPRRHDGRAAAPSSATVAEAGRRLCHTDRGRRGRPGPSHGRGSHGCAHPGPGRTRRARTAAPCPRRTTGGPARGRGRRRRGRAVADRLYYSQAHRTAAASHAQGYANDPFRRRRSLPARLGRRGEESHCSAAVRRVRACLVC